MHLFGDEPEERRQKRSIFADEPEETPSSRRRQRLTKEPLMPRVRPGGMQLFGEEPEETFNRCRTTSVGSKAKKSSANPMLFGDEEEEAPRAAGKVESDESDDDDEGVVSQPATLHLNWSGLKMFEQASFLRVAAEKNKPAEKKRAYDNSKRLEKVVPKQRVSYQSNALDPQRLISLFNKPECK